MTNETVCRSTFVMWRLLNITSVTKCRTRIMEVIIIRIPSNNDSVRTTMFVIITIRRSVCQASEKATAVCLKVVRVKWVEMQLQRIRTTCIMGKKLRSQQSRSSSWLKLSTTVSNLRGALY